MIQQRQHAPAPDAPLSRDEAIASVGPGWARLVANAWDVAHSAGWPVLTCKEKFGRLVIYLRSGDITDTHRVQTVGRAMFDAEEHSAETCEACGAPGVLWNDVTHDAPEPLVGVSHARWVKTLCVPCAWRYYGEGDRGWDDIAGRWCVG